MTKLYAMRGYSGSGKSTRAAEIAKKTNGVVVNRDLLRLMLLGSYWTGDPEDEDRVTTAEEAQVKAFLSDGVDTIVDATHLNPSYLRKWARLATRMGVDFEVVDCRVSYLHTCFDRDNERADRGGRSVGEAVIRKQAKRFPQEKWPLITAEPFVIEPAPRTDPFLRDVIIVDIDGTLAHIPEGGRSPFDYSRVSEDVVDTNVRLIVAALRRVTDKVFIVSGRDDTCYQETFNWLVKNQIQFDRLIMRPADAKDDRGNKLPDYQVKYQLFNEHIRGKYNVRCVLDDRDQVVEMWRKLGLKCLQVAPGDF